MNNFGLEHERERSPCQAYRYTALAWLSLAPFVLMFGVPLILYGGTINIRTIGGVYELERSHLLSALFLILAWLTIALTFARIGIRRFTREENITYWTRGRVERFFLYFFAIGLSVFVIHQLLIFPPAFENIVHLVSFAAYWALGLGLILILDSGHERVVRSKPYILVLTIILFANLTLLPIALGKAAGIATGTSVVLLTVLMIRTKWITKLATIGFALIFVVAGLSIKTTLREALHEGGVYQRVEVDSLQSLEGLPKRMVEQSSATGGIQWKWIRGARRASKSLEADIKAFSDYDPNQNRIIISKKLIGNYLHFSIARTVHRLNHLGLLGHVMVLTPTEIPSWSGVSYLSLLYLPIPRALWPSKPNVGYANTFGRQYRLLAPDDMVTSVNIDPLTEAWMNGGWLAVVVSGAAMGLLFGLIFGWLNCGGDQHLRFLVAITVALHVVLFESETALIIGGLMQSLLLLAILMGSVKILSRGYRFLPGKA